MAAASARLYNDIIELRGGYTGSRRGADDLVCVMMLIS
jgi:hypothetical protein